MNWDAEIDLIEKALDIKLYEYQKDYLKCNKPFPDEIRKGRGNGKTLIYIVRILITPGDPISVNDIRLFSDTPYYVRLNGAYSNWFTREFIKTYVALRNGNVKTRQLIFNKNRRS